MSRISEPSLNPLENLPLLIIVPNISIINEASALLRLGLPIGPSPAYFDNDVAEGGAFHVDVASVRILDSLPHSDDT